MLLGRCTDPVCHTLNGSGTCRIGLEFMDGPPTVAIDVGFNPQHEMSLKIDISGAETSVGENSARVHHRGVY